MEKSYLRRPLAALLSLLMVIGMFTVCGFGVLADGETVDVTLKTWSVDDLDAAAQATGTKNYLDSQIYHKTDYIIGAQRVDTSANGNWLFHSQGLINNDNNTDGTPDFFKQGDTLRVVVYLNGELNTAAAWGFLEVAYDNNAELTSKVEFTPDVIAQMTDTYVMGQKVKMYTWDILLDKEGYSDPNKLMQSRIWVNGGATLACYGVEYINVTTNTVLWGLEPSQSKTGGDDVNTFITVPALATYTLHPAVVGSVPEENRVYTAQTYEGAFDDAKNGDVNATLFKGLTQTLDAGHYALDLDFATKYGLGVKKFTVNVYADDSLIFGDTLEQADYVDVNRWSPDSGIGHKARFEFDVSEENSGKEISFEVVCHNQTHFFLSGMSLSKVIEAGATLAQWDYKDLLNNSDRNETNAATYDESEKATVGMEIIGMKEGTNGFWGDKSVAAPVPVTLTDGQTIRFVLKMFMPKGVAGAGPFFRVYHTGKVADKSVGVEAYNNSTTQTDPTYGYSYKEIVYEVKIDNAEATKGTEDYGFPCTDTVLQHWFCVPGANYNNNPAQFYDFEAYDVTDGAQELLYTISGEQIAAAMTSDANYTSSAIEATTAGHDVVVGYKTVGSVPGSPGWSRFDAETGPITDPEKQLAAGDVLEIGVRFWAENGLGDDATSSFGYTTCYTPTGGKRGDQLHEVGNSLNYKAYDALPTMYDETYGYPYKLTTKTYELTEQEAADLNAKGFYALIGPSDLNHNHESYPITHYGYYFYNQTKGIYYQNFDGAQMMGVGGSGTVNEPITYFKGNMDKALDGYLNAGASAVFSDLTTTAGAVGQYAMNFAVTGEEGAEYTLTAYSVDGETVSPVGSRTFTASGSAETVQVAFNVRDSLVGKDLTFGMASSGAKLGFTGVTFEYVGALAADYTWSVADIAAASLDEDMTYEFTDKVVVGASIFKGGIVGDNTEPTGSPWELFYAGSLWTGDLTGVQAGDTLRMEVDMGTDEHVTNLDGKMASLKLQNDNVGYISEATSYTGRQYNDLVLKADPDFGYFYRTLTATITLPADNDELMNHIATEGGFNFILDNCQITNFGRNIYRAAIVNERTGETIFEIKGDEILPHLFNTAAYPSTNIEMVDGQAEFLIGSRVYDDEAPQDWWGYADYYIPAMDTIEDGMTLHVGAYVYYPNGGPIANGTGFTFKYKTAGASDYNDNLVDAQASPDVYANAEELWNDEYGYAYKDQYVEFTVPEGAAEAIAANGIKCLIGAPNNDFIAQPLECYGLYIYDPENEVMLYEADGAALYNGSFVQANLKRDPIIVTKTDPSKASAVVFSEGASGAVTEPLTVTFADLGLTPGVYSFNVAGDENIEAQAVIQLGEYGDYYTIGTEPFVVTEDILDATIGFVLQKEAGATAKVSGVELMMERELTADDAQSYEEDFNEQNQAAAGSVITKIDALPKTITLADEDAVVEARTAFDALTASQKALVTNIDILEAAEDAIEALKNLPENVANVIALIDALPEADAITLDNEAAVTEAQNAYNALSDEEKELVSNADKLTAAAAKIDDLKAQAVEDMINALPAVDAVTEDDRADVEAARDAYDALTDTQKALVSDAALDKLEALEAELDGGDIAYGDVNDDGKVDAADALQCLQHSVELITLEGDAFTAADVDLDDDVDANDALYILQFSVELIDTLPVEQ